MLSQLGRAKLRSINYKSRLIYMPTKSQQPSRHHYIPVFYLKRWAGKDGRVCEFSKPYKNLVKPRRTSPSGTGFVDRLYELPGVSDDQKQAIERYFMSPADTAAADALEHLHSIPQKKWNVRKRSAWSRFIVSMLLRNPEELRRFEEYYKEDVGSVTDDLEEQYQNRRSEDQPATFAEYMRAIDPAYLSRTILTTITKLIDNPNVGEYINNMLWGVINCEASSYDLLTSDRPVVMTNGLNYDYSYIVMPIGRRKIFYATKTLDMATQLKKTPTNELVRNLNFTVVGQAKKYVYAADDQQLRFVQNNMSINGSPSLVSAMRNSVMDAR